MKTRTIQGFKMNKRVSVELPGWGNYKRPQVYDRIPASRIVGIDTESFPSEKYRTADNPQGLRTNMVQLDTTEKNIILDTTEYDMPLLAILDELWSSMSVYEEKPSSTKQRSRRDRKDGSKHRDGTRQTIEPTLLSFFNEEYEMCRLLRNDPIWKRAVRMGEDSVTIPCGEYSIEVRQMVLTGSAPHFEWFVRKDHRVMRLFGRDVWGYLKRSLRDNAESFLDKNTLQKGDIPKEWFNRNWESFDELELEEIRIYAKQDARIHRELYEALILFLTQIDEHVICSNGLLPVSAPSAAAKIAFSKASVDEWQKPSRRVMQIGAWTYAGARVGSPRPGRVLEAWIRDVTSMYPWAMTLLPDPCTVEYVDITKKKFDLKTYRGKFGCMLVSGHEKDEHSPSLRTHNVEQERLQYVTGSFTKIWASIPEVCIGVARGTLEITQVHDGFLMVGSNEHSFLKLFIEDIFKIKNNAQKDSPLYLIAKLLMNAFYGKLAEININKPQIDELSEVTLFPRLPDIDKHYDAIKQAYIEGGREGLEIKAHELYTAHPEIDDTIMFYEIVDQHQYAEGKAGMYYLPHYASQITGLASATIGCFAYYTHAISYHTDSITTHGECVDEMEAAYACMERAGYSAPRQGLGSFTVEMKGASGIVLKGSMYSLTGLMEKETDEIDKTTGKKKKAWKETTKQAYHGIAHVQGENKQEKQTEIDRIISQLWKEQKAHFTTKRTPMKLKSSLRTGREPGTFEAQKRDISVWSNVDKLGEEPNSENLLCFTKDGHIVWKQFCKRSQAIQELVKCT